MISSVQNSQPYANTQNSNELFKEDVSSIVQSSLGQILRDSNNYNKNTFYA